jgi:2'-hydroxyisoflavone reductase
MKLLVIGGTVFVGWHLVAEAIARGHHVTMFNRGRSDPEAFPGVKRLHGDRNTDDIAQLAGQSFDAVIDTCGYEPTVVARSARLLSDHIARYVFLSSLAVYRDRSAPAQHEESPVVDAAYDGRGASADILQFPEAPGPGPSKLRCEQEVEAALPGRALQLRLGLLSGARDVSDRFPYWPWRIAQGGDVLAPGHRDAPVQVMHGQDFARFALDLVEHGETGVYNVAGPERTMGEILDACLRLTGHRAVLHWVDDDFLVASGLKMYGDLPLWVTARFAGVNQLSTKRAVAAGLHHRSLDDLLADTIVWTSRRPPQRAWRAGLSAVREAELLERYRRARTA